MTAVAIYARYSSDQQRDASIEDQIRLCQERAKGESWRVHNFYTDHGLSGASLMRPGLQMLLQDALAGRFEAILTEGLDRLSRDQEDTAGLFKRLRFAGVRIITLSEGEISELHVGLKGTMNALYLKDLADKTRRGLRGRIEAGKSGGGNSYGYNVVKSINASGEPVRGERYINEGEAAIVRRIFNEYANGTSPKAIARKLNRERVTGPAGKDWTASTVHGHQRRGTGILNNELYIGRIVWNRLRYIKDPDTGRRVSRINPPEKWISKDVPELRIIAQDLWERVKARQQVMRATITNDSETRPEERRRPKYLLSGLLKCAQCGGSFVKYSHDRLGCSAARNKGTCSNLLTIKRTEVEAAILNGLRDHLMDPKLCAVFCEEYTKELNRLRRESDARLEGYRAESAKVTRELERLVQAIMDGVPGHQVKDKIGELEARKAELSALLDGAKQEPVRLHPNMGEYYRKQVANLVEALNAHECRADASRIIRSLIDRVELRPVQTNGERSLAIDLTGHVAGILGLATKAKRPLDESDPSIREITLVAGARNRLKLNPIFRVVEAWAAQHRLMQWTAQP